AAGQDVRVTIHQRERLYIVDHRFEGEAATMRIGCERAADGKAIGAGLLLPDSPLGPAAGLRAFEVRDQLGPYDAGLNLDDAAIGVEGQYVVQCGGVD